MSDEAERICAGLAQGYYMIPCVTLNVGELDGQSLIDMNNLSVGYRYEPYVPAALAEKEVKS